MMAAGNNLSPIHQSLVLVALLRGGGWRAGMNRRQSLTREAGMTGPDGAPALSRRSAA